MAVPTTYLRVILASQMRARGVISLPFLGLLAAGRLEQDFLQLFVAQLPLVAVGPLPVPVGIMVAMVVPDRYGEAKGKQEDGEKSQKTAGQGNGAETAQSLMRIALPWRSRPHGGDQRSALVDHVLSALAVDHVTASSLLVACQPHLDEKLCDQQWVGCYKWQFAAVWPRLGGACPTDRKGRRLSSPCFLASGRKDRHENGLVSTDRYSSLVSPVFLPFQRDCGKQSRRGLPMSLSPVV